MSIFGKVIAKKQRVPDFMEHGVLLGLISYALTGLTVLCTDIFCVLD